jgi:hypothetical protein
MSYEDVMMMRLIKQATAQGLAVAQNYRTREVMLLAATGEVHIHRDVSVIRAWLRHYAGCGRYGRRCFQPGWLRCACVPVLTATYQGGSSARSGLGILTSELVG